jgi:hypothetical protein
MDAPKISDRWGLDSDASASRFPRTDEDSRIRHAVGLHSFRVVQQRHNAGTQVPERELLPVDFARQPHQDVVGLVRERVPRLEQVPLVRLR